MFTHAGSNINTFTEGSESSSNLAWISETYQWAGMYEAIREANVALKNLPTSTFEDKTFTINSWVKRTSLERITINNYSDFMADFLLLRNHMV